MSNSKRIRYILIACEGLTEEAYFREIRQFMRQASIKVIPICLDGEQKGEEFVGKAWDGYIAEVKEFRSTRKMKTVYKDDEVWCVYDVDNKNPGDIIELEQKANERGMRIIQSNPCIELWFYLHFNDVDITDKSNQRAFKAKLKTVWPKYSEASRDRIARMDYLKTLTEISREQATERAEKLKKAHVSAARDHKARPSTNMGEIVKSLFDRKRS